MSADAFEVVISSVRPRTHRSSRGLIPGTQLSELRRNKPTMDPGAMLKACLRHGCRDDTRAMADTWVERNERGGVAFARHAARYPPARHARRTLPPAFPDPDVPKPKVPDGDPPPMPTPPEPRPPEGDPPARDPTQPQELPASRAAPWSSRRIPPTAARPIAEVVSAAALPLLNRGDARAARRRHPRPLRPTTATGSRQRHGARLPRVHHTSGMT